MVVSVNLIYWRCRQGNGNFGDELSKIIVREMIGPPYQLNFNAGADLHYPNNFVAVGSYIHGAPSRGKVWGSGLISEKGRFKKDIEVHAVRGPRTREALLFQNVPCPEIYGDPALLLPKFYTPETYSFLNNKIAVIPHWSQIAKFSNLGDDRYHFINPLWSWTQVINELCSCKAVLASSLHGLICADAYGIPNARLTEVSLGTSHGGDFKFLDYFESQGRPYKEVKTLTCEWDELKEYLWTEGNKVDLDKLIKAFPWSETSN